MGKYRGQNNHRKVHPKIYVFSHTEKAELEYFKDYKNYLKSHLLLPRQKVFGDPIKLINFLINFKEENVNEKDGDLVWAVFDVDDFYCDNLIKIIKKANKKRINIAFFNECFELWILLHFQKPSGAILREDLENKIRENIKSFKKGQNIFNLIIEKQDQALKNSKELLNCSYDKIDWKNILSKKGNPSTSLHFLIEVINRLEG